MQPPERTIRVGGIDVYTWVGGRSDPLLVLHGAGGTRGVARWTRQVAEPFTVWEAPTQRSEAATEPIGPWSVDSHWTNVQW